MCWIYFKRTTPPHTHNYKHKHRHWVDAVYVVYGALNSHTIPADEMRMRL